MRAPTMPPHRCMRPLHERLPCAPTPECKNSKGVSRKIPQRMRRIHLPRLQRYPTRRRIRLHSHHHGVAQKLRVRDTTARCSPCLTSLPSSNTNNISAPSQSATAQCKHASTLSRPPLVAIHLPSLATHAKGHPSKGHDARVFHRQLCLVQAQHVCHVQD